MSMNLVRLLLATAAVLGVIGLASCGDNDEEHAALMARIDGLEEMLRNQSPQLNGLEGLSRTAHGQLAYATGNFASPGDARGSLYILRKTTTDATQTELLLDGVDERITVSSGRALAFDMMIIGRTSAGDVVYKSRVGVIENTAGTTRLVTVSGGAPPCGDCGRGRGDRS